MIEGSKSEGWTGMNGWMGQIVDGMGWDRWMVWMKWNDKMGWNEWMERWMNVQRWMDGCDGRNG